MCHAGKLLLSLVACCLIGTNLNCTPRKLGLYNGTIYATMFADRVTNSPGLILQSWHLRLVEPTLFCDFCHVSLNALSKSCFSMRSLAWRRSCTLAIC